jgi:hypothetical protein
LKNNGLVTLCASLDIVGVFLAFASQFTDKQVDFSDPAGITEQQWLGKIDDLRVNRLRLARTIGACERDLYDKLNDGTMSQADLEQIATDLKVRPVQAMRAFCGRFIETVVERNMPLKDYLWAIAAPPSDVLQALAQR